jgi:hypothetical protein
MALLAPYRTTRRKVFRALLTILVALIVAIAGYVVYSIHHVVHVIIPHSYANWTTGNLLVEYMETHDGNWPHGWEDLHEATSLTNKGEPLYWDFTNLPGILKIDWKADPETLAKAALASGPSSLKVVTRLDGSKLEDCWQQDANQKVAGYLIKRYSTSGAAKPQTTPK